MKKCLAAMLLAAAMVTGLLSLAACNGGNTTAATMYLRRTQGTVSVSNGSGKEVPALDNLGLYSGYGVNTRPASYAWIDLDDVKLVKLDQSSEISIEKEGKALSIEVRSGSLFFNVTQPLEDDEALNIRSSTMLVGIRGTCGWVEDDGGLSRVYILEGKVECSAEGQNVQVNAWEVGALRSDGSLVVEPFSAEDIPAFVLDDLDADLTDSPEDSEPPTPEPTIVPTEGVTWSLDSGTLTISGTGDMENYGPYEAAPWYDDRLQIHTVIIGDGVTSVGGYAFSGCSNLTGVTIPDGVTAIGGGAFTNCSSLKRVTIPGSVSSIGDYAFSNCGSLINVTMFDGVASIGGYAFLDCSSLEGVTIPGSVTSMGSEVFSGCSGLTNVTILEGVPYIPLRAFSGCGSLERVTIPGSVTTIGYQAFASCSSLAGVTIPNGVASIEGGAFFNCSGLESVTIPGSVSSIEGSAFWGCSALTSVTIPGSVSGIEGSAFWGCSALTSVTILDGVTYIDSSAFSGCGSLERVAIPGSVSRIGNFAFEGCSALTDVYYGGDENQWEQIDIAVYNNNYLLNATIHHNS